MRISTKGRYAMRMMIDLALHREEGYLALGDVAERQNVSKKYLEQIVALFAKSGLLRANRGSQGGYMLAKDPSQCTVGDILRVTEGPLSPVACADPEPAECERSADCPMLPVWQGLADVINRYLDGITLQDVVDRMGGGEDFTYVI